MERKKGVSSMIHVFVTATDVNVTQVGPLTSGTAGLLAVFHFSQWWDDLQKTAVFRGSGATVDAEIEEDKCYIPTEVLAESGGRLQVGVYGTTTDYSAYLRYKEEHPDTDDSEEEEEGQEGQEGQEEMSDEELKESLGIPVVVPTIWGDAGRIEEGVSLPEDEG